MTSSRFAVGVHILALLQEGGGEPVTSEYIAGSVNTNPAVVRRILSMLAEAGITTSRLGAGGGALLARPASGITLLEVFKAVEGCEIFAMHRGEPNQACPVGRHIRSVLEEVTGAAQRALEAELGDRTVSDVVQGVKSHDRVTPAS
ncbi:MAG: Rrf2 family transcriptional regulator [Rhodothermales bacterium]